MRVKSCWNITGHLHVWLTLKWNPLVAVSSVSPSWFGHLLQLIPGGSSSRSLDRRLSRVFFLRESSWALSGCSFSGCVSSYLLVGRVVLVCAYRSRREQDVSPPDACHIVFVVPWLFKPGMVFYRVRICHPYKGCCRGLLPSCFISMPTSKILRLWNYKLIFFTILG